jgi:hypothetical protein
MSRVVADERFHRRILHVEYDHFVLHMLPPGGCSHGQKISDEPRSETDDDITWMPFLGVARAMHQTPSVECCGSALLALSPLSAASEWITEAYRQSALELQVFQQSVEACVEHESFCRNDGIIAEYRRQSEVLLLFSEHLYEMLGLSLRWDRWWAASVELVMLEHQREPILRRELEAEFFSCTFFKNKVCSCLYIDSEVRRLSAVALGPSLPLPCLLVCIVLGERDVIVDSELLQEHARFVHRMHVQCSLEWNERSIREDIEQEYLGLLADAGRYSAHVLEVTTCSTPRRWRVPLRFAVFRRMLKLIDIERTSRVNISTELYWPALRRSLIHYAEASQDVLMVHYTGALRFLLDDLSTQFRQEIEVQEEQSRRALLAEEVASNAVASSQTCRREYFRYFWSAGVALTPFVEWEKRRRNQLVMFEASLAMATSSLIRLFEKGLRRGTSSLGLVRTRNDMDEIFWNQQLSFFLRNEESARIGVVTQESQHFSFDILGRCGTMHAFILAALETVMQEKREWRRNVLFGAEDHARTLIRQQESDERLVFSVKLQEPRREDTGSGAGVLLRSVVSDLFAFIPTNELLAIFKEFTLM